MDGRWSPQMIELWIDQVEALDKWVALFFSDPLAADPLTVEVVGGMYAREQPLWSRSSPYALTLDEEAVFRSLAPGTSITAIGLMTDAFSGLLTCRDLLATPRSYPAGGTFRLDAGEWVIGIEVPAP